MSRNIPTSSDYFQLDTPILTSTPFSVSVWFNASSTSGNECPLLWIGDKDSTNQYWQCDLYDGAFETIARASASYDSYVGATANYTPGTWGNGVGIFRNANNRSAYFNGGNEGNNTDSGNVSGADRTAIGRTADSTPDGVPFSVSIAEIGVWNRELTAHELTALAQGFAPSFFKNGLVAYYPLIGRNSPETDFKGGVNLTASGSPATATHPRMIYPT